MSVHYDYKIYVSLKNSESEVPGNYATDNAVVTSLMDFPVLSGRIRN